MNKLRIFVMLVLFIPAGYEIAVPAQGMADTVRYVATLGACTGMPTCYATIQEAIDAADSGDVLEIATGTYSARLAQMALQKRLISRRT